METAQDIVAAGFAGQMDELSTRLILDGAEAVGPADFESFAAAAAAAGMDELASAASRIAAASGLAVTASVPERTRAASEGIEELRRHIDRLPTTSSAANEKTPVAQNRHSTAPLASLAADVNLIREFITESNEHLVLIETELLALEKDRTARESLNTIFRGFHTIKGLAGFLDFSTLQSLTHEVETLLDLARTDQIVVTPELIDLLLESNDVARHELALIAGRLEGKEPASSRVDGILLDRIRHMASHGGGFADSDGTAAAILLTNAAVPQTSRTEPALAAFPEFGHHETTSPQIDEKRSSADTTSIRIDTAKLDHLMDTVGEMVIAQTLLHHSPLLETTQDAVLQRNLIQLARTTAGLQRIATAMRMVPIGSQFQKTARMVRDLARRFGKQIVFESSGEDAELDKSIAEQLSDPLLHMVRNSIDHGIETPEERIRLGKDPTARIRISAFHQSGQIGISISDDGRGLDRKKILAKALQNGLIQPGSQPATDNEIFALIFEPGFSTAEKVTDTSGRGVGMDVVRKHVQKLRGRIEISSEAGVGTTFLIRLPLTLAIIEGLVVVVGDQRYVAPIFSIREILRPTKEILSTVHGRSEMALVRGSHLPIVRLHRSFGVESQSTNLTDGMLIVTESGGKAFCLFVDRLLGNQEVVIKSLGGRFKDVSGVAGCAILGDGRVGLILDIDGIYQGRR